MSGVSPVPEEFRTITPQLAVRGVAEAVAFYARAFGAEELFRNPAPDGKAVMHCEMLLGDSRFFLMDENPDWEIASPLSLGDTPVTLHVYVPDVDALFARAVEAGAEVLMPLGDQFWGDRYGILRDPFGHRWSLASRIEDPSRAELERRAETHFESHG